MTAMSVCKESGKDKDEVSHYLYLVGKSFEASLELLPMLAQYFRDIVDHVIEEARQISLLVEQRNYAVDCSSSYRTTRENLTGRLETEATTQLAKMPLEKATKKKKR